MSNKCHQLVVIGSRGNIKMVYRMEPYPTFSEGKIYFTELATDKNVSVKLSDDDTVVIEYIANETPLPVEKLGVQYQKPQSV